MNSMLQGQAGLLCEDFALFETMLLFEDSIFLFHAHLMRLYTSALHLGFPCHHLESFLRILAQQDSPPQNMPHTLANSLALLAEYNGIDRTKLAPLLRHANNTSMNLWSSSHHFSAFLRHANTQEHTPLTTKNPSILRLTLTHNGTLSYSLHTLKPITNTTILLETTTHTSPLANHKTTYRTHFDSAAAHIERNSCFDIIYMRCADFDDIQDSRNWGDCRSVPSMQTQKDLQNHAIFSKANQSYFNHSADSSLLNETHCAHQFANLCILTEGSRSNIIVACANGYYTSPTSVGILEGTLRNALIKEGICATKVLTQSDMLHANGLYCANSVRGIIPVTLGL